MEILTQSKLLPGGYDARVVMRPVEATVFTVGPVRPAPMHRWRLTVDWREREEWGWVVGEALLAPSEIAKHGIPELLAGWARRNGGASPADNRVQAPAFPGPGEVAVLFDGGIGSGSLYIVRAEETPDRNGEPLLELSTCDALWPAQWAAVAVAIRKACGAREAGR